MHTPMDRYAEQISIDVSLHEDHAGNLPDSIDTLVNQVEDHFRTNMGVDSVVAARRHTAMLRTCVTTLKQASKKLREVDAAADACNKKP